MPEENKKLKSLHMKKYIHKKKSDIRETADVDQQL